MNRRYEEDFIHRLPISGATILDAGCGIGELFPCIAEMHPRLLYAIDIDADNLSKAKLIGRNLDISIEFILADISNISCLANDSIDVVLAIHSAMGITYNEMGTIDILREFYRVLRRKGILMIISSGNTFGRKHNQLLDRYFRLSEALFCLNRRELFRNYTKEWAQKRLFEIGFAIQELHEIETDVYYNGGWLINNIDTQVCELHAMDISEQMRNQFLHELRHLRTLVQQDMHFDIGKDYVIIARKQLPIERACNQLVSFFRKRR